MFAALAIFLTCRPLHPFSLIKLLRCDLAHKSFWKQRRRVHSAYFINVKFKASNCSVSGFGRRQQACLSSSALSWPPFSCHLSSPQTRVPSKHAGSPPQSAGHRQLWLTGRRTGSGQMFFFYFSSSPRWHHEAELMTAAGRQHPSPLLPRRRFVCPAGRLLTGAASHADWGHSSVEEHYADHFIPQMNNCPPCGKPSKMKLMRSSLKCPI